MFTLKVKHLLYLVLGLVVLYLWFTHNRDTETDSPKSLSLPSPPSLGPEPYFEFFMLVLTWPPSFCKTVKGCNPAGGQPYSYFTIHGLWPQRRNVPPSQQPTNCRTAQTPPTYDTYKSNLTYWWPNLRDSGSWEASKSFYDYEWHKHGTCCTKKYSANEYIELALRLAKENEPLKWLEDEGIRPGVQYSFDKMQKVIIKKWHHLPQLRCVEKRGQKYLTEIGLCFTNDTMPEPTDCDNEHGGCGIAFPAPQFSPHPSPPPPLSRRVELLEFILTPPSHPSSTDLNVEEEAGLRLPS